MALTPPFVVPRLEITANIGSTPEKIFGSQYSCIIDSISLCNTSESDLFFDLYILGERMEEDTPVLKQAFHSRQRLLKANETLELELGSLKTPESGDLLYASSDFSGNRFDMLVSYREYRELAGIV